VSERRSREERLRALNERLRRLRRVPDDVLADLVFRYGLSTWIWDAQAEPELTGDADADRELAEYLCAGCPVLEHCLELELRWAGSDTVGVFGGTTEDDRRELYRLWRADRDQATDNQADDDQTDDDQACHSGHQDEPEGGPQR